MSSFYIEIKSIGNQLWFTLYGFQICKTRDIACSFFRRTYSHNLEDDFLNQPTKRLVSQLFKGFADIDQVIFTTTASSDVINLVLAHNSAISMTAVAELIAEFFPGEVDDVEIRLPPPSKPKSEKTGPKINDNRVTGKQPQERIRLGEEKEAQVAAMDRS